MVKVYDQFWRAFFFVSGFSKVVFYSSRFSHYFLISLCRLYLISFFLFNFYLYRGNYSRLFKFVSVLSWCNLTFSTLFLRCSFFLKIGPAKVRSIINRRYAWLITRKVSTFLQLTLYGLLNGCFTWNIVPLSVTDNLWVYPGQTTSLN